MFTTLVTAPETWFEGLPAPGAQEASLWTSGLCNVFRSSLSAWCFNFLSAAKQRLKITCVHLHPPGLSPVLPSRFSPGASGQERGNPAPCGGAGPRPRSFVGYSGAARRATCVCVATSVGPSLSMLRIPCSVTSPRDKQSDTAPHSQDWGWGRGILGSALELLCASPHKSPLGTERFVPTSTNFVSLLQVILWFKASLHCADPC